MSIKQPELYGKRFIQGHIDELNNRTERQNAYLRAYCVRDCSGNERKRIEAESPAAHKCRNARIFLIIFSFQCFLDYLRNHSRNIAFKLRHFFYCTAF